MIDEISISLLIIIMILGFSLFWKNQEVRSLEDEILEKEEKELQIIKQFFLDFHSEINTSEED